MADKTLATFRIDPEEWEAFKNAATSQGSNASALLTEFVRWYLAGNRLDVATVPTPSHLDTSLQQRLDTIEQSLDELIDKRIEARLDAVRSQLEELRGKLKAR